MSIQPTPLLNSLGITRSGRLLCRRRRGRAINRDCRTVRTLLLSIVLMPRLAYQIRCLLNCHSLRQYPDENLTAVERPAYKLKIERSDNRVGELARFSGGNVPGPQMRESGPIRVECQMHSVRRPDWSPTGSLALSQIP